MSWAYCGRAVLVALVLTSAPAGFAAEPQQTLTLMPAAENKLTALPEILEPSCRGGRARVYDECSDQKALFDRALRRAAAEGKVLLVSYGAEWCIWCHVFDQHLRGKQGEFTYTYGSVEDVEARETSTVYERAQRDVTAEAADLAAFAARSFVLVHLDMQFAPRGDAVLRETGAKRHYGHHIPYIFSVDRQGKYAAHFIHERAEVRRDTKDWYRGYDRRKLLAELKRLHEAAVRRP